MTNRQHRFGGRCPYTKNTCVSLDCETCSTGEAEREKRYALVNAVIDMIYSKAAADEVSQQEKDWINNLHEDTLEKSEVTGCEFCAEGPTRKLLSIQVDYHYENPEAYSYPDVAFHHDKFPIICCPMCGRQIWNKDGSRIDREDEQNV